MTREEFRAACRVIQEGAPTHSMYAIEDARYALKPIARYAWRQSVPLAVAVTLGWALAPRLLPDWPWFAAYCTVATASACVAATLIRLRPLSALFAPDGFSPDDVSKAAYHVST